MDTEPYPRFQIQTQRGKTMANLTKRAVVLNYVGPDQDGDIVFSNDQDLSLALTTSAHSDMSSPQQITVTIEPGDRLTPEDSEQ